MSEKEEMLVPRDWNYIHRTADEYLSHADDSNAAKKFYSRVVKNEVVCNFDLDIVNVNSCF